MSDAFYEQVAVWSQVAASILFVVFLVYAWRRWITPAVVASQQRKNAELVEAQQRRDAEKEHVEEARRALDVAAQEALAIAARAAQDALRLSNRIVAEARAEGLRTVRNAEGELERERATARGQLRADLLERAMQIAREAAAQLDPATDRRLVDEAVAGAERGEAC